MIWFALLLVAVASAFIYWTKCNEYWRKMGVPQTNPMPLFGDAFYFFFQLQSLPDFAKEIYSKANKSRYLGFYQFLKPTLSITDPELIKQITIKDFEHFTDHQGIISSETDQVLGRNLFALNGKPWHDMRITISPSFTSSKMRFIYSLIQETSQGFVDYFLKNNQESYELNMKDAFTRFTNDVIASSAFGIKVDSMTDRENEFYIMGKKATNLTGFKVNLKIFLTMAYPKFSKFFDLTLMGQKANSYFLKIVKETLNERRMKNIVRPDVLHLLLEAQKGNLKQEDVNEIDTGFATVQETLSDKKSNVKMDISDVDIAAQAMVFFIAGFDGVSFLMCFVAYELAVNPDVQTKLRKEINAAFEENNGEITYEALLRMKYLDMVVSETLRKWSIAGIADRKCTKDYTIQPISPSEKAVHLKKGDIVWIPIYAIHRDPKYYPDPDRFDPERFNDENKENISPYTYLPFGIGPRNCVGSRFALLETKAIFASLLRHFEIVLSSKMKVPLKIDKKSFNMNAEGGFWMHLNRLRN